MKNLIKEKEQIAISYAEKFSELESDIFDLQIQVAEKNSEIEGLNDDIGGLNDDIGGLNNDIGGLNDQIGELKEENIKLKKQLRDESIFGPIMQIFKLKNLWYLLLIPFLLIGLILYNRTQEEKALEIEKKHFFSIEKPPEEFLRLWEELSGRKLLEKSLNKHHLYKQPRKKTYFFIKGFTKYFMDLHMDDDKELAINLKHIITEIFNIDVAYSLTKYNLDSDMDSINYFNKGISKAKEVFDL